MIYQTTSVVVTGSITADTETPAAASLADNTANPSTTLIGSCLMVYDGSTWDRALGNSTDGVLVNLGANNDVTMSATGIASATLSSVAVSASSAQLLASNSARSGVIIHNDSSATLYIKFGTTATSSIGGYTYSLGSGGTLELPGPGQKIYTGRIDGIWSSASGNGASITEL